MNIITITIDMIEAARACASLPHTARHDADLVLKTVLTEACDGPVIRPWSVVGQVGSLVTVEGYSDLDGAAVRERMTASGSTAMAAVRSVASRPAEEVEAGALLHVAVRLCPTIHVTAGGGRRHGERDAFLVAVDRGETAASREAVYAAYLAERLPGATVETARLARFSLGPVLRPHRGASAPGTGHASRVMPDVDVEAVVRVTDPAALAAAMRAGVGRQRAYGRGMVRVLGRAM